MTQLLRSPKLFDDDVPDFSRLKGIKDAVMTRCGEEKRNKRLLLSHGLQQLVELAMVARDSAKHFGMKGFLKSIPVDSETNMLKKIRDKWKPDSVETALVYAIRLMKNLDRKQQNRRGSRHNYDMAALNEMDVINIDKMKSKKRRGNMLLLFC